MTEILHITSEETWRRSQRRGRHLDPSLEIEGFIHCSSASQVLQPANALYSGRHDLVLLRIDADRLEMGVVHEDTYGHGAFPHVYGPINLDAVTGVVRFPPDEDGSFSLPPELA